MKILIATFFDVGIIVAILTLAILSRIVLGVSTGSQSPKQPVPPVEDRPLLHELWWKLTFPFHKIIL